MGGLLFLWLAAACLANAEAGCVAPGRSGTHHATLGGSGATFGDHVGPKARRGHFFDVF